MTDPRKIESFFDRLWPLNRSITGPGFRESLDILAEIIPTERLRFQSGSRVLDWKVPLEWKANDAYLVDPLGQRRAEFKKNNIHLVGYSIPFRGKMNLSELKNHIYTMPEKPDAVPYVTSYYKERWGFCMTHTEFLGLPEGEYEIVVDTELYPGHVEIGEAVLHGDSAREVLFSSYLCHPSLANNELSGPLVTAFLYERIKRMPRRRYTYRFVLSAESIGTISYLSLRGTHLKEHLIAGYQMTCIGDPGQITFKTSRRGNSLADRAARIALRDHAPHSVIPFDPGNGSDERHYCSPGFNLPVGSLMRTMYSRYPQYHTSDDNKDFISFAAMMDSVEAAFKIVTCIEENHVWKNTEPFGEPQLGPRGLYPTITSEKELDATVQAMMWLLNYADGEHDLLDIAEISGQKITHLIERAEKLSVAGLLERIEK